MWTNLPRGVARCQHIKVNGTRCDSPALKGKAFCYFHYRSRLRDPAVSPNANSQEPSALSQEPKANSEELQPAGVPLNAEFFLLEDANSIQCALQWVLRRILAASIDRRQAALLLYGLQIAAANIRHTRFEPHYKDIVRDLPTAEPAETDVSPRHLERVPTEPTKGESKDLVLSTLPSLPVQPRPSHIDCHPELAPGEPSPVRANGPASLPSEQLIPGAQAQQPAPTQLATDNCQVATAPPDSSLLVPDSPKLATDHCPLTTVPTPRRNKTSRRLRTASVELDRQMLASSPRTALSLMFQREVKRHLARLDFPNSPETDPAES